MAVYKGWNAAILYNGSTIGFCDSASVEIATGVEPYYGIGYRQAQTLIEGNEEITGSISKAWINTDYLSLLSPGGSTLLSEFTLIIKAGVGSGGPQVACYNCKFETGSIDVPQDGFLTEDYDFRAQSVVVETAS